MKAHRRTLLAFVLTLAALSAWAAAPRVVGVEAGYAAIVSSRGLSPDSPHGLASSLYYGYVVHERPRSHTVLSLAAGYDVFPGAASGSALHNLVYGVEYAHTFFRQAPVALLLDYGLLFNLILQSDREGYAFGHHTRLGLGGVYRLGERDSLSLKAAYNFVSFPHFELAEARMSFPSLSLRYSRRL